MAASPARLFISFLPLSMDVWECGSCVAEKRILIEISAT